MHFQSLAFAALASWADLALAAPQSHARGHHAHGHQPNLPSSPSSWGTSSGYEPTSSTFCYTKIVTTPAPYGTTWSTSYTTCTSTQTSTTTVTTSLPTSTSTITSSTTVTSTASTSTETDTETDTITSTTTTTETDTAVTTTTVSTDSTSTIPAPSTFTPVQSSLPGSSYSGSGGTDPVSKREADVLGVDLPIVSNGNGENSSGALLSKPRYPQGVTCQKWMGQTCITTVTTITSTSTVSPTTTITTTSTDTTTTFPSATATITTTSTATETDTSTTTTTLTSTATEVTSSTTLYAACATNNLADNVGGVEIGNGTSDDGDASEVTFSSDSAYDTCVSAFTMFPDTGQVFGWSPSEQTGIVTYTSDGTCTNGQASHLWTANLSGDGDFTVGNIACGEFNSSD